LTRPNLTSAEDRALHDLLKLLQARGYAFTTPTIATHARILARRVTDEAHDLRDVFGWNMAFRPEAVGAEILDCMERGGALVQRGALYASAHRVASCDGRLFLHGPFPPLADDAVFFGPDSYRFAAFLKRELTGGERVTRLADIGAGSGVGAIVSAALCPNAKLTMTDINAKALRLSRINAAAAGIAAETTEARGLEGVADAFDAIIANPPYLIDAAKRMYRHGGDQYGARLSLDWTNEALPRLAPRGRFLLYTASAIVSGADAMQAALATLAHQHKCTLRYEEIDPDVWGEELQNEAYAGVERIALVTAVFTRA
jgi:methylase of polypeptide subunit release factors